MKAGKSMRGHIWPGFWVLSNMLTRRNWLKQASFLTAVTLFPMRILRAGTPDRVPVSDKFPLDVAAGDVDSSSAILWTYYEGFYPLRVCVWTGQEEPIWQEATRMDGGFVQLEISGLLSNRRYQYAFFETGFRGQDLVARSIIGSFKSAPDPEELVPLKFGAVSCVKHLFEPVILEHAGARTDLDFFLHNGDNSYNDGMVTLNEFRSRWAKTLGKKGSRMLRRSTGMIAALDDHEIEDNFNVEAIEQNKLMAGKRAFFEHMPMRRNPQSRDQIWRKLSWGKTADIFVLDCRTERVSSEEQYISPAQMRWLKTGLLESKAMFKVIMNPVPIGEYAHFPLRYDRWEGFPRQREEILRHIDFHQIKNLLWVSGDFHFASLGRVSYDGPGSEQMEVLAGPGAQIPNVAGLSMKLSSRFDWIHVRNNYVTIACDVKNERFEIEPVYGV